MVGNVEAIDNTITALKNNGLVLTVVEVLQDYLSSKIKFSENEKRVWSGQLHLMKNMEKKFSEHVLDV